MKADVLAADGAATARRPPTPADGEAKPLRGPAAMLAKAMDESRSIPTATSFRTLPVDTLDAKRKALNGALAERGMKVSFTHLIAWAIVEASREWPSMSRTFEERDGKPHVIDHGQVNLGIAVDIEKKDGSRGLMVPRVLGADGLDFKAFHAGYEELIRKTRENKLTADDFQGTNITLTNPGGLGTVASVPRLMTGQGTIIATGSIAYPAEWAHSPPGASSRALGVSKVMTMTSTYDHRIIQGAESGSFLRRIDAAPPGRGRLLRAGRRATSASRRASSPTRTPPRPPPRRCRASRRRSTRPPPSPEASTRSSCRRCRPRPRCSRPTARTATWPRGSTRSAATARATRRSSPRTST